MHIVVLGAPTKYLPSASAATPVVPDQAKMSRIVPPAGASRIRDVRPLTRLWTRP